MTTDHTALVAVRQAVSVLRLGAVGGPVEPEQLARLGAEARALVEQLVDLLHEAGRDAAPQAAGTRDLVYLRRRLSGALTPGDDLGDPRSTVDASAPARR